MGADLLPALGLPQHFQTSLMAPDPCGGAHLKGFPFYSSDICWCLLENLIPKANHNAELHMAFQVSHISLDSAEKWVFLSQNPNPLQQQDTKCSGFTWPFHSQSRESSHAALRRWDWSSASPGVAQGHSRARAAQLTPCASLTLASSNCKSEKLS